MIANYHTHTWRCKHATGTEEEYVQAAIRRGLKRLGFADHSPYCFPDGYYSGFRMKPEDTAVYADDIFTLRDRYRDLIDIHLGVEIEYYPAFFADTVSMLRDNQVEYLILGQHFLDNEIGGSAYSGVPSASADDLQKYCRQIMDACNTGLVTYIAHPDLKPPFLCLVVSGGHSHLIEVLDYTKFRIIGRTRDDAAGEAFDKAARAMGFPYPGGVFLDKASHNGDPAAYKLPRPRVEGSP